MACFAAPSFIFAVGVSSYIVFAKLVTPFTMGLSRVPCASALSAHHIYLSAYGLQMCWPDTVPYPAKMIWLLTCRNRSICHLKRKSMDAVPFPVYVYPTIPTIRLYLASPEPTWTQIRARFRYWAILVYFCPESRFPCFHVSPHLRQAKSSVLRRKYVIPLKQRGQRTLRFSRVAVLLTGRVSHTRTLFVKEIVCVT